MKTFLAALAGSFAALVLLLVLAAAIAALATRAPGIEDHSWLVVRLDGELLEYDPPGSPVSRLLGDDPETLQRVLGNLEKAQVDDRIDGVIFEVSADFSGGWAKIQELRGAAAALRAVGKKVIGYAPSFDARGYLLLAACDEIVSPSSAYISFTGFTASTTHLKQALDRLGIRPNLHRIADYKSAAEMLTREDMSGPARENRKWMLDETWRAYTEALESDRGFDEDRVRQLMTRALFTASAALDHGLIDRVEYWDELEMRLRGEADALPTISQARYADVDPDDVGLGGRRTLAVIHAQGLIAGRESGVNPLLGVTMGHETIAAALRRAREDEDITAVVLRIDSRGGDSLTSDLIARAVERTAAEKPVVVSMVDVAASGGYMIAYRASRLLADPLSVTGSIGSISAKLNIAGLYERLGISHDAVTRGPMALLGSDLRDFSKAERERFEANHWAGFNAWLRDVAKHRGMAFERAERLAHGRVWSGRQAVENGLVDELGGLRKAVTVAKRMAGIDYAEGVSLVHYPESKGLLASLMGGPEASAGLLLYRFARGSLRETWNALVVEPELRLAAPMP